jgi:hypothetical protein
MSCTTPSDPLTSASGAIRINNHLTRPRRPFMPSLFLLLLLTVLAFAPRPPVPVAIPLSKMEPKEVLHQRLGLEHRFEVLERRREVLHRKIKMLQQTIELTEIGHGHNGAESVARLRQDLNEMTRELTMIEEELARLRQVP